MAKQSTNGDSWRTVRGNHVLVGADGTIKSGPKELKGKKIGSSKPMARKRNITGSGTGAYRGEKEESSNKPRSRTRNITGSGTGARRGDKVSSSNNKPRSRTRNITGSGTGAYRGERVNK